MNHMIGVIPLVENGVGRPESEVCEDEPRRRTPPSPSPPPTRKELRSEAVVRQPARWVYTGSTIGYPPSTGGPQTPRQMLEE
jgi:hypothetical protein